MTLRNKIYGSLEELPQDLDDCLEYYNNERTHQGKMCCGRAPMWCPIRLSEVGKGACSVQLLTVVV